VAVKQAWLYRQLRDRARPVDQQRRVLSGQRRRTVVLTRLRVTSSEDHKPPMA
jgi:hypothetical protein